MHFNMSLTGLFFVALFGAVHGKHHEPDDCGAPLCKKGVFRMTNPLIVPATTATATVPGIKAVETQKSRSIVLSA